MGLGSGGMNYVKISDDEVVRSDGLAIRRSKVPEWLEYEAWAASGNTALRNFKETEWDALHPNSQRRLKNQKPIKT